MTHKWKLLPPGSGPLVATTNIHIPSRYAVGWRLFCTRCEEYLQVPYDDLDSEKIAKFVVEQKARDDCQKKNRKNLTISAENVKM